ncbi:MAG: LysR family transcriptional regulator [Brachybacterium sp.]|nr:LysR family transcriptional regulator [Brachybacterium sp.]
MLLRQLEYFVAVARERHFARAAQSCRVSQPTLSDGLRKLEEELQVPLVRRRHAFEGLTPEGERLVVWARRLLADRDALEMEATTMRSGLQGRLSIGVVPSASTTVAGVLARFCDEHPLASVTIDTKLSTEEIVRRLDAFELDAGICYPFDAQPGLTQQELYRETWTFLASDSLVSHQGDSMTWEEASRYPLAVLETSIHGVSAMTDAFATAGVQPEISIETDSVASLFALVNTGCWASVIPDRWATASGGTTHLTFIGLTDPQVQVPIVLALPGTQPQSPLVRALAESMVASPTDAASTER